MTILFLSDWREKYPNAIIDTKTKNTSFLRFALLLKSMGIKNHSFCLSLLNPELQGVDPHDPNLTDAQKLAIALECNQNYWYIIRACSRAPSLSGNNDGPYLANRGNIAAFWLFFNHITFILIQIRQTGKSFSIDTLMSALLNIYCTNTKINLLTKDETLRSANLARLKEIINSLPPYLRQLNKGDVANTEEIIIKSLKNRYEGHIANKSPKMALNLGRGLTSAIVQCDEFAFLYNNEISIPAMLAAGGAARDAAKASGDPYGTIFTTTAGKKNDRDGAYAWSLVSNAAIWTEAFYDCVDLSHLEKTILRNVPTIKDQPKHMIVNCTFSHRQLGYSDEWLRDTILRALSTGENCDRDFFNMWTSSSLSSPFTAEQAETIKKSTVEDYYSEIDENYGYITRWYIHRNDISFRMNSGDYILSLDTSEAGGNDDITLTLTCIKTGEVIAAGSYNETNLITFAEWLCSFIVKFKRMTVIIERRSTGGMIIDYLLLMLPVRGEDPFKRLYNTCVQNKDENPQRYKDISTPMGRRPKELYITHKKTFGFTTSGFGSTARSMLYSTILQNVANVIGDKIKDAKTIDQMLSLIKKDGRIDHQVGGHDDQVISLLLGHWLLIRGVNLDHYGIDSSSILVDNKIQRQIQKVENSYQTYEQKMVRREIEELYEMLKNERDDFIFRKLENRMLQLNSKLIKQDSESFSVEQLLDNLKKEKKFNRLNNSYNNNSRPTLINHSTSHSDAFGFNSGMYR